MDRVEALEHHLAELHAALSAATASATDATDSGTSEDGEWSPGAVGLPLGTVLHEFELPDLTGRQHLRSEWLSQPWLLTFFNPACPHSVMLLRDLATLQAAASSAPSSGSAARRPTKATPTPSPAS